MLIPYYQKHLVPVILFSAFCAQCWLYAVMRSTCRYRVFCLLCSVLVVCCDAKHVKTYSDENNEVLPMFDAQNQYSGDAANGDFTSNDNLKKNTEIHRLQHLVMSRSQTEIEKQPAWPSPDNLTSQIDQEFQFSHDYEEENKAESDRKSWRKDPRFSPTYLYDQSLDRVPQSESEDAEQAREHQPYMSRIYKRRDLYYEIFMANEYLHIIGEAYAQYVSNTTWQNANSVVSHDDSRDAPLLRYLKSAVEEAKRFGPFPEFEASQDNSTSSPQGNFENDKDKYIRLMRSCYEIVSILSFLMDMVQLRVALSEVEDEIKRKVLENFSNISSPMEKMILIVLSELHTIGSKPSTEVLSEILRYNFSDFQGGILTIRQMKETMAILANTFPL